MWGAQVGFFLQTEDTITLLVDWVLTGKEQTHRATAVYTASWTAPTTQGIHSGQHLHYMGSKGDIAIDQAHRGYDVTVDGEGKTRWELARLHPSIYAPSPWLFFFLVFNIVTILSI